VARVRGKGESPPREAAGRSGDGPRSFGVGRGCDMVFRFAWGWREGHGRTELLQEARRREWVVLERKSPPLNTKGGAPSSFCVGWRDEEEGKKSESRRNPRAQSGVTVPQEKPKRTQAPHAKPACGAPSNSRAGWRNEKERKKKKERGLERARRWKDEERVQRGGSAGRWEGDWV
jgi:hypothetical protein